MVSKRQNSRFPSYGYVLFPIQPVGQSLRPVQSLNGNPKPVATSSSLNMMSTPNANKRQRKGSSFACMSDDSDIEYDEMGGSITDVTRDSHVYAQLEAEELANAEVHGMHCTQGPTSPFIF